MPFAVPWIDPDIVILSKVRQRKIKIIWYCLYVESKKWCKWTYLQNRNPVTDVENKFTVTTGEGMGLPWGLSGKNPLPMQEMQETQVQSLGQEDPLE